MTISGLAKSSSPSRSTLSTALLPEPTCVKLNLSSLLSGVSFDKTLASDVAKYLQLSSSGNDAVLKVDVTGTGNFTTPAETINLTGANVAGNLQGMSLTQLLNDQVIAA